MDRAAGSMMVRERVVGEWITALRIMHIAHHEAATLYSRYNVTLGVMLVLVSATLGATAYGTFRGVVHPWIVGLLGLTATILAGLQTLLGADARSKGHHAAAAAFGEVRRDLEELVAFCGLDDCEPRLRDIRSRWNQALKAAPSLPAHIHGPIQGRFTSKEASPMDNHLPQSGSGLTLEKSDLRPLWQYFEQRGSEVKSTMLTVVALLIGFAAALLGYGVDKAIALDPGPGVTQPALLLAVSAAGIAVIAYAEVVIRDFGEHINRNFARADTVRLNAPAVLEQVLVSSEADRPEGQPLPNLCTTIRRITRSFGALFAVGLLMGSLALLH